MGWYLECNLEPSGQVPVEVETSPSSVRHACHPEARALKWFSLVGRQLECCVLSKPQGILATAEIGLS
jgi:hypothetical protein